MSYLAVGVAKSQCSSLSDGESYEGYGENEYSNRLCDVGGGGSTQGAHNSNNHNNSNGNSNTTPNNNNNHNNSMHSLGHSLGHSNDGNNNLNDTAGIELDLAPHVVSSSPKK